MLMEHSGEVVTREDMQRRLWPADTYVDFEHGLNTSIKKLRKALGDSVERPSYIETLPRVGYRFLVAVEPVVEKPLPSAGAASKQVEVPPHSAQKEAAPKRSWLVAWAPATISVLALIAVVFLLEGSDVRERLVRIVHPAGDEGPVSASVRMRPAIAVLGFKNLTGQASSAWVSTAVSEMLDTELAAGESLRVITGDDVARMKADLVLEDQDSFSRENLQRISNHLGAELVVLGGYTALGKAPDPHIRLDVRLQDARSGDTLAALAVTGTQSQLFDMVARLGAELRPKLGLPSVPAGDLARWQDLLPSNDTALQFYAQGLERLRASDSVEARDLLEKAVAADPQNAMVHAALASAWSNLGYEGKAKEEAKRALDLSVSLPQEQKQLVQAGYYAAMWQDDEAAETYSELWKAHPDKLAYGLRLADSQSNAGKSKDALKTVAMLRRLPQPEGSDPQIDLAEAKAQRLLSDFSAEEQAGVRAAAGAQARGQRESYGMARLAQGWAELQLGHYAEAKVAFEDCEQTFHAIGYQMGVAFAKLDLGILLHRQGDIPGALQAYEETLAIRRQVGNKSGEAKVLNNIAILLKDRGQLKEADHKYAESIALAREIQDEEGVALAELNRGEIHLARGQITAAHSLWKDALNFYRNRSDRYMVSATLCDLGGMYYLQGHLAEAEKTYQEAQQLAEAIHKKDVLAYVYAGQADVLEARGELAEARRKQNDGLALRQELGDKQTLSESHLALARLGLLAGDANEAKSQAQQALQEFQTEGSADRVAIAEALLAEGMQLQGNGANIAAKSDPEKDNKDLMNMALAHSLKTEDRLARLAVLLSSARLRLAAGSASTALPSLQRAIREADQYGFVPQALEGRLLFGQAQVHAGLAEGQTTLLLLKNEAARKGFARIAQAASAK
jgi:TolB-like protein/Tfp pilus assembly protein PilF